MQDGLWNLFLATGSIDVYMAYKSFASRQERADGTSERGVALRNGDN